MSVDRDALDLVNSRAENSLERQFQTLSDIDTKASKIMRINVLIIGAILSIISLLVQEKSAGFVINHLNAYFLVSGASLFLSTIFSGITYTASQMRVGIGVKDLEKALEENYSEKEALVALNKGYSSWQRENENVIKFNSKLITGTILFLIYSVIFLGTGAIRELMAVEVIWLTVSTAIICTVITGASISYLRDKTLWPFRYVVSKVRS